MPTDIYDDPRWYRSGKAFGPGFAQIEVNTDHPRYSSEWSGEGEALVLHELHHCLRWPYVRGPWTIGEVTVLEGLAMLSEGKGSSQPLDYGTPPRPDVLRALCERAWRERASPESDETAWFRDRRCEAGELDAPVNYHVGRTMMQRALDRLGVDPFGAAGMPMEKLLAAGR